MELKFLSTEMLNSPKVLICASPKMIHMTAQRGALGVGCLGNSRRGYLRLETMIFFLVSAKVTCWNWSLVKAEQVFGVFWEE